MIRIYGASDDLVYIENRVKDKKVGSKEIGCFGEDVEVRVFEEEDEEKVGGISVTMSLGRTWKADIQQFPHRDNTPIPWPVSVKTKHQIEDAPSWMPDYSVIVDIDCAFDDVEIEHEKV